MVTKAANELRNRAPYCDLAKDGYEFSLSDPIVTYVSAATNTRTCQAHVVNDPAYNHMKKPQATTIPGTKKTQAVFIIFFTFEPLMTGNTALQESLKNCQTQVQDLKNKIATLQLEHDKQQLLANIPASYTGSHKSKSRDKTPEITDKIKSQAEAMRTAMISFHLITEKMPHTDPMRTVKKLTALATRYRQLNTEVLEDPESEDPMIQLLQQRHPLVQFKPDLPNTAPAPTQQWRIDEPSPALIRDLRYWLQGTNTRSRPSPPRGQRPSDRSTSRRRHSPANSRLSTDLQRRLEPPLANSGIQHKLHRLANYNPTPSPEKSRHDKRDRQSRSRRTRSPSPQAKRSRSVTPTVPRLLSPIPATPVKQRALPPASTVTMVVHAPPTQTIPAPPKQRLRY